MPFIDVKLSCELTAEKEALLKSELGKSISLIPGKSEGVLMINFTDNCRMWFAGEQDGPIAFVDVNLYGETTDEARIAFAKAAKTALEQELGAKHIFLKYVETTNWK